MKYPTRSLCLIIYRGHNAAVLCYVRNVLFYPSDSEVLAESCQAFVLVSIYGGPDI